MYTLSVRLPKTAKQRLEKIAQRNKRSKSFSAREAILLHLEDLEDIHLAERALKRIRRGKDRPISIEEAAKRYSVDS